MHRLLATLLLALPVFAQDRLLLQRPTLSRTHIVFSFAGDLWSVPRAGGDAIRLTSGPGIETDPSFSPDGTQIAFTGEYDGNVDVFVMPATGGVPKRITYHPGPDIAAGWTPDGKRVLFLSPRATANDGMKLFSAPAGGGFPSEIPLPIVNEASYSPDASHLAYVPLFQWQAAWKRYRGGQTTKIWIADASDSSVIEIPRQNSNDFNPMWVGETVYFLSDRNGPVTLFAYDTKSKAVRQLVANKGLDLKSASAGPGAIVYSQFGALHLYDLQSGEDKPVAVKLAGDLPELRSHFVNVAKRLRNPDISPNGARAVFEARGEILSVPAEKGDARNLSNTPAAMERQPVWSPDGASVAYLSDESGAYELHVRAQNGMGAVRTFKLGDKPAFYSDPAWSPDGKRIAYLDNHSGIWYLDLATKKNVLVDHDYYSNDHDFAPVWSPDSKWIAYSKQLKSFMRAIMIYSLATGKPIQVTDGMSEAKNPLFDAGGKYLYFSASTDSGAAMQPDIHAFSHPLTRSIYLVVLAKDVASPFAPESDEEKLEADKKDEKKEDKPAAALVQVDADGIGQRVLAVPMPPRRYNALYAGKAGVLLATEEPGPQFVEAEQPQEPKLTVHRFDFTKRKADVVAAGVQTIRVSRNGEKMLLQQDDKWFITALKPMGDGPAAAPPALGDGELKTQALEVRSEPLAEWKQMYKEVWRIQRDFFYDPGFHGLDLKTAQEKYSVYLDSLASRHDLNQLFVEMLGEMTVGHMFVGGGDSPDVKRVQTGLLGADYKIENGRYRFARIYDGENWNPGLRAPLTQPGVNVQAGDYLLAVAGRDVQAASDIDSFFEGLAGKATLIKVGPDPNGARSREVTVVPVADESRLRHLAWIEDNRRQVDRMSNGRVAYVHMPDTGRGGYVSFNRYFFAQVGKEGLIVDDRFNHGGQLATDIIDYLKRTPMSVAIGRDGAPVIQPQGAIFGPKVMITNQFAGSGGDALPWYFKRAGVGKLVGERTWGGLVGLSGFPQLMDGGGVTAPNFAIWNATSGEYDVENKGVAPDVEVKWDPAQLRKGHDPQLETAVQIVMDELAKNPPPQFKQPPYPKYH